MANERNSAEEAGTNVVHLPHPRKYEFVEKEVLNLSRDRTTVFVIAGGSIRLEREIGTPTGPEICILCRYHRGEVIRTGKGDDSGNRYVAEIQGVLFELTVEDFERAPQKEAVAQLRSFVAATCNHEARQLDALSDQIKLSLYAAYKSQQATNAKVVSDVAAKTAKTELEKKLDEANARIAALTERNRDLVEQHEMAMSVKEAELEEEVNAHLTTRQNLDSTTRQLNKSAETNQQLRKVLPDVVEWIESTNAETRRQAEKFPEALNKILVIAYKLPSRSPDEIMNLLWKIDRGENIDQEHDLGFPQLDIVVVENELIQVDDAELIEDGNRYTMPMLEPPPSQTIVSRGRTLPSGEALKTNQGVGERSKPILSTREYQRPKLRPLEPKK